MEAPGESESEMGKEQFLFMLHVVPVLLIAWVVPYFGVNSWLLLALLAGYLIWVQRKYWETERRRIQFEERKKINAKRAMTEGETLRWLNTGLKVMWPVCMENFASQYFFKPMAPWFLNKYKPKFVREVTLLSLHLGGTPPEFTLIRALPLSQDGDDVVFMAAMEFLSDKNMNAQMTVLIKGIKTTFYISRLYIKGTVKFSVKFVEGWPVLGRVRFSFANTPIVNMTARPYTKNGMDMRFIPGAANWLEETLGTALEQSVVEPYMLVIDIEKLVSNTMYSPRPQQGPQDFFTVEHKSGFSPIVLVEILEAGELMKTTTGAGFPDPVVEVMLGAHKEKTKTTTKTTNPTWKNEMQRIPIVNWELPNLLTLRVISKSKTYTGLGRQTELGICSTSVKDYRDGSRHVVKLPLENVSTGWIRFAITVDPHNSSSSQPGVEKPHASAGSQPTTQDIQTVSPPDSTATRKASAIHTRSSSIEDVGLVPVPQEPDLADAGSSEFIKMPYGGDGAFSIQCPGKEESLQFPPDPAPKSSRKVKGVSGIEKGIAFDSKDRDADSRVKRSMKRLLGLKNRSTSKVSNEIPPPEREMAFSEHSGYTSSLDRSAELKVYHGALRMNLQLSPDMTSRDAPDVDIHSPLEPLKPLKLETVLSQDPELTKTPDTMAHSTGKAKQLESTIQSETDTVPQSQLLEVSGNTRMPSISSLPDELKISSSSSQRHQPLPEKQNSKNPWWKPNFTKRPKKRKGRGSRSDDMDPLVRPGGYEAYDPSDTSASQSFRKEQDENTLKALRLHQGYVTTSENSSILTSRRSQSCRQDASDVKKVVYNVGAQSLRFDSSLLNTIHERQLDRPHYD